MVHVDWLGKKRFGKDNIKPLSNSPCWAEVEDRATFWGFLVSRTESSSWCVVDVCTTHSLVYGRAKDYANLM